MKNFTKILIAITIALAIVCAALCVYTHTAYAKTYGKADIKLIARVVYAEARNQPFLGKMAVALTVINRYESGEYGKSLTYITRRSQFCKSRRTNKTCIRAVKLAIANRLLPSNCYYFQRSKRAVWRSRPRIKKYCRIGNHTFYFLDKPVPVTGRWYINTKGKLRVKK